YRRTVVHAAKSTGFDHSLLTTEAASIAFTARLKSLRLLMAQASSNETAWCAASIIASVGLASSCSDARARRLGGGVGGAGDHVQGMEAWSRHWVTSAVQPRWST